MKDWILRNKGYKYIKVFENVGQIDDRSFDDSNNDLARKMFQIWLKQDMEKKNILSDTNVAGGCVACKGKKCYFAMMLYKKVPDFIEIGGGVGAGPGPSAPVVNISDDVTPIK